MVKIALIVSLCLIPVMGSGCDGRQPSDEGGGMVACYTDDDCLANCEPTKVHIERRYSLPDGSVSVRTADCIGTGCLCILQSGDQCFTEHIWRVYDCSLSDEEILRMDRAEPSTDAGPGAEP